MARRTVEELSGTVPSLVYIAGTLYDAKKAERVLTDHGIEYVLDLEPFASTSLMRAGEHTGLFVYVPTEQHGACLDILERNGLMDTVSLDQGLLMEKSDGA